MKMKNRLKLDWCSFKAAKYACEHWHYSRKIPLGKLVKIGVWEIGKFKGVIIYSMGTNKNRGSEVGIDPLETCELTRVALREHETPVSRLIRISLKLLKMKCPGIRLVVSYADKNQNHLGKIYQASNWVYVGESPPTYLVKYKGEWVHSRSVRTSLLGFGGKIEDNPKIGEYIRSLPKKRIRGKFKYLYPLDPSLRDKVEALRKPYPKKISDGSDLVDTPGIHPGKGGSIPTPSLQII